MEYLLGRFFFDAALRFILAVESRFLFPRPLGRSLPAAFRAVNNCDRSQQGGWGGILFLPSSIAASSCLRLHSKEKGEEKGGEISTLCSSEAAAVSSPHAVHPMSFHAGGPFGAMAPMHRWVQVQE